MRKNKKFTKYSAEEKEKILKEFMSREGSAEKIVIKYNLNSRKILYDWKKIWDERGTLEDTRGKVSRKTYTKKVEEKISNL